MPREEIKDTAGTVTIVLDGDTAKVTVGAMAAGELNLAAGGRTLVRLAAADPGGNAFTVFDSSGVNAYLDLDTSSGTLYLGSILGGRSGQVALQNLVGMTTLVASGEGALGAARVEIRRSDGRFAFLFDAAAPPSLPLLDVRDEAHKQILTLSAGAQQDGVARLHLGSPDGDKAGHMQIFDRAGHPSIQLHGRSGDIVLRNADCAEEFDLEAEEAVEPGAVLVITGEGRLGVSREPYDPRVAGVVSGAGDFRPGLLLDSRSSNLPRRPVALLGKVFCRVDAGPSPVAVGDLLCTSQVPGHAMAARDRQRAFGAVLGKALRPLAAGRGLIPVLVALQ